MRTERSQLHPCHKAFRALGSAVLSIAEARMPLELLTPAELPRWVPGKILAASDELGWRGVTLRAYRYEGQDVEVPAMRDFMIVAYHRGRTRMQRRFDGAWTRVVCEPGDLSLLTRSQRSHWHWSDDIDVNHVYLSESIVANVAAEAMERSIAEVRLHDVLKTQDPIVTRAVDAIAAEARSPGALGGKLYVESLGTMLAVHLLRHYASVSFRGSGDASGLSASQCRNLGDYIEAHLHEHLSLHDLATSVGLGLWTFTRRFRASFGMPAHAYLIDQRIERARQLLLHGTMPLKQVASLAGFSDQAHMTRAFHARLHRTPAQLRRSGTG
jgi:AraC family transcriptional regulator